MKDQDNEKVSETSSAKKRQDKRSNKFECETPKDLPMERSSFNREKTLELTKKVLEMLQQTLQELRELERKVKTTALENDELPSQSACFRDKF